MRLTLEHELKLYRASAETARKTIDALHKALMADLPRHSAADIWDALAAKADEEGAMHRDDMIAVLKEMGFR